MIDEMRRLAREKDTCVLATVSRGKPHCSLMAYACDDGGTEIYMATLRETNKYRNLEENPFVSLLIDTREERPGTEGRETKAMTVSGIFERIEDDAKRAVVRDKLLARHPHLSQILDHPDADLLCIRITSFLLLNGLVEAHFEEP